MDEQALENQFASTIPYPQLMISQGPAEVAFSGQSAAGSPAIGTSFIQGTGEQAAGTISPIFVIGSVILLVIVLRHVRL